MQIRPRRKDNTVSLIVTELAPEYHQAAQDMGYALTDEGFVREVVTDATYWTRASLNLIVYNSHKYLEAMFAQKAGLQPVPWDLALLKFLKLVNGQNIDWWLVGSAATAARGIDIQPGDIDLCCGEADAPALQGLLWDYTIQPLQDSTKWIGKWFGRAFLDVRLEWVGGVHAFVDADQITDFGPTAHARLETIQWQGYAIRVPPLDLQLDTSLRRGLVDRAEKIRQALKR